MADTAQRDMSEMRLICPDCGWSGLGRECVADEIMDGIVNRSCPSCARLLAIGRQVFAWCPDGADAHAPGGAASDRDASPKGPGPE